MDSPPRLLQLRNSGMFSNVNEVVQHVHLALQGGYEFTIEWSKSPYRVPDRDKDPWLYYFRPPFRCGPIPAGTQPIVLPAGVAVLCQPDCVIAPARVAGRCETQHFPADLGPAHRIVRRHIRLNPRAAQRVEDAAGRVLADAAIGLHIRGPQGVDGGSGRHRARLGDRMAVPYATYVAATRKAMAELGVDRVLVCSDSADCVAAMRETFGNRVITTDALRTPTGEMHVRRNRPGGMSGFTLGLDIVTDAYLLARCAALVHGRSNVSFFVRALNPDLPALFAYDPRLRIRRGAQDTGTRRGRDEAQAPTETSGLASPP